MKHLKKYILLGLLICLCVIIPSCSIPDNMMSEAGNSIKNGAFSLSPNMTVEGIDIPLNQEQFDIIVTSIESLNDGEKKNNMIHHKLLDVVEVQEEGLVCIDYEYQKYFVKNWKESGKIFESGMQIGISYYGDLESDDKGFYIVPDAIITFEDAQDSEILEL